MVPKLTCILQLRKRGREKKKGCIARERVLQENPYLSKMTPTKLTLVKEESEKVGGVVLGGTSAISIMYSLYNTIFL
jgi:hypothetical protein